MALNTYTHSKFESPLNAALGQRMRVITGTDLDLFTTAESVWKIRRIGKQMMVTAETFVQIGDGDSSTGAVFSLEITNGTTTKTVIALSTAAQAGGGVRPSKSAAVEDGVGWVVPAEGYWLQLRCTTAASGTPAAVAATVHLFVSGETEASGIG